MKGLKIVALLFFVLAQGACCSKKGACPVLKFNSFNLVNFTADDVTSVNMIRYKTNSNFTIVLDTSHLQGEATSDEKVFKVATQELSIEYDYGIYVVKLNKLYKINNFTGTKIACGKCFLRQNNQYGYELSGYSVNNRPQSFDGTMSIIK